MANKTLCEFAAPSADNVAIGPQINMGVVDFDLKSSLITMAQASPFYGKPNEDANAHLQQFLEICSTYTIKGVSPNAVKLRLFLFSLLGRAKQWFYANRATVNTWVKCSMAFLSKFFPMGKTNALRGRISSFQQTRYESIPEAWERLQEYTRQLEECSSLKRFMEKMVSNMGWSEERIQTRQRGMHTVKETELLAAKLDLLMKRLDDHEKRPQGTIKALDSHITCEVCGNTGHSGNDCLETREEAMYMGNKNNGYCPQGGQGWSQPRPYYQGGNNNGNFSNQPSLKDLVFAKAKTTDALSKKLAANDKILENINVKLDGCASAFQNQLSFNEIIETQLAQLASLVLENETGRIPRQPGSFLENVKAITTREGKSTCDPPYPNPVGINKIAKEAPSSDSADKEDQPEKTVPQEYCDTRLLSFPQRSRKLTNICPLSQGHTQQQETAPNNGGGQADGALQQCHTPQAPMITCSIGAQQFDQALCDLGASVSVMPKDVFDKLNFTVLAPTPMCLQLADLSVRYPSGIAEDVPVKIRDFFIPVDFVVLYMDMGKETPLILGYPFFSTAGANIDVGTGSIRFHINGKEKKFEFQPRTEQCSMVRIKYGPNPQNIQVVEMELPKTDSLVKFMQNFLEKETTMPRNRYWRKPVKPTLSAKKLEQSAQRKPPSASKPRKVWKEKRKTPAPSPSEMGGKSTH
ncbi:uncharacterized protein [Oryza sativa Japonica Group]|uniref:uncharacterized protein n=1 Tax=Oryza sativa subsp. japonica TaxID=39947 RepID=UPI00339D05E0